MLLSVFVSNVKRRCQISDPSILNDQYTIDIINFLNNRMQQVWRMWPWSWLYVPISFVTVPNQNIYSIIGQKDAPGTFSSVGDIIALTGGSGGYLVPVTYKRYLEWLLPQELNPVTQQPINPPIGTVINYVKIGSDANGNLQILLWQTPANAFAITGYGKQRIVPVTVANISQAGFTIPFFPAEAQDVLEFGVESDVYDTVGQEKNQAMTLAMFNAAVEELKGDESSGIDDDMTTPPPDMWIFNKRQRGGTMVT